MYICLCVCLTLTVSLVISFHFAIFRYLSVCCLILFLASVLMFTFRIVVVNCKIDWVILNITILLPFHHMSLDKLNGPTRTRTLTLTYIGTRSHAQALNSTCCCAAVLLYIRKSYEIYLSARACWLVACVCLCVYDRKKHTHLKITSQYSKTVDFVCAFARYTENPFPQFCILRCVY